MRNIVLIAHDAKKRDIIEWARFNRDALISKRLFATRSTGEEIINRVGLPDLLSALWGGRRSGGGGVVRGRDDDPQHDVRHLEPDRQRAQVVAVHLRGGGDP